ncbi:MAG: DinB family protein [Bryobacterales bacterium]|nr:DinB family protein [Bryobacterales bacterium]MBV9397694.1 DinB family protein [Bryobacterales bacterium]
MSIAQSLIPEFDYEMANTRRTLERLPQDKLEFKPDPKSMPLGRLAGHIAEMVNWGAIVVQTDSLNLDGGNFQPFSPTTRQQLLAEFDKNVAAARGELEKAGDSQMMQNWSLIFQGKPVISMPRVAVVRSMVLNHIIHHRAQLTVYYRMNGVPVPALYGPSADEGMPAAAGS